MKLNNQVCKCFASAPLALALTCSTALAASDIIPTPAAMEPGGGATDTTLRYGQWYSANGVSSETFDTTKHSLGNIAGAVHVVIDCPGATVTPLASANLAFGNFFNAGGDNGWLGAGNQCDAAQYESLTFDLFVDPTINSNLTSLSMSLWGAGYERVTLGDVPLTTAGWQHVVLPIPNTTVLADCTAYGPYEWYNTTASTPPCHVEYWFDNVKLVARPVLLPPPALSISPVKQGQLFLGSGVSDGGGARQGIYTMSAVPWVGLASSGSPVTYSMTIASLPNPAIYSNFQAQIFLVAGAPNGTAAADWNFSDMGFLQISDRSDGTAAARLMWKTNDANDNTMLWNTQFGGTYGTNGYAAGTLALLNAPSMVGTWSLTFTGDDNVTVTGPGPVSTNFTIPADWISSFNTAAAGAGYAAFGVQPNTALNAGQPAYFSRVAVTGGAAAYAISDDFTVPPLNATLWGKAASDGTAVGVVPTNAVCWVNWNLPANNFDLITTATLGNPYSWLDLTAPAAPLPTAVTVFTWDNTNRVPVPADALASRSPAFFAMVKRGFSRLQVLLPGETNAPNTMTGKVGTPLPQSYQDTVTVTVNACDQTWHLLSSTDTVHLDPVDPLAYGGGDIQMTAGVATFALQYYDVTVTTNFVLTASDTSTNNVANGVSSPLRITYP